MMICSPDVVRLNDCEQRHLRRVVFAAKSTQRDVLRASIVLLAADDTPNARIAAHLRIQVDTARKWRHRFCDKRLEGLKDLPRCGRPRQFTAGEVAGVKALACELPAETGTPLSRWSCPELAYEAVARGLLVSVSASTVRRWLAADAIKP
jgi:transposase